jgi:hypothetical protein
MTLDYQTFLIAVVFVSQIVVFSFYTPMGWQRYHARLFQLYPREEYPLLHPIPREEVERKLAAFKLMYLIIGVGAALTFVAAVLYAEHARGFAGLMAMCLLVQLLPLYIALPLTIRIRKALQALPPPSRRSAELRRWRATDFISPLWIGLGLAMQALNLACAVVVYLYRPGTLGTYLFFIFSAATLLAMCYALSGHGYKLTTRPDPYMSQTDTFEVRQRIYRGLFVGCAVFGALGTFTLLFNAGFVQFDIAYLFVGFSVLFQLDALVLVARQNRELRTRDFSVYRAEGSAEAAR